VSVFKGRESRKSRSEKGDSTEYDVWPCIGFVKVLVYDAEFGRVLVKVGERGWYVDAGDMRGCGAERADGELRAEENVGNSFGLGTSWDGSFLRMGSCCEAKGGGCALAERDDIVERLLNRPRGVTAVSSSLKRLRRS